LKGKASPRPELAPGTLPPKFCPFKIKRQDILTQREQREQRKRRKEVLCSLCSLWVSLLFSS
jgi:hypothetical protein